MGKAPKAAAKNAVDPKTKAEIAAETGYLKPATQLKLRHILCEKFGKSQKAVEELKAGKGFGDVAREYSEDKARTGGALGWMARGGMIPEFAEVCFEVQPSTLNQPIWIEVKTLFGYHIVMIEDRQ